MYTSYLGKVRRGHGKGHHGLLLWVKGKLCAVICTIWSSSLVAKVTILIATKVGLSIVRPIKGSIAVSIVIAGPITVWCPILHFITEDFLWSVVITAITAATVLTVVIVTSTVGVTIPPIISKPATSTAP